MTRAPAADQHEAEAHPAAPAPSRWRRAGVRMQRLLSGALDVVTPPVCLGCHEPLGAHDALCPTCWRQIDFIRAPVCDRLGIPLPYDSGPGTVSAQAAASPPTYARARAVARYAGVMRELVHDLKFRDRHDAVNLFGRWISSAASPLLASADLIVPVPLHRWKLLRRRFNQSAILANELARRSGLPVAALAVSRTRRTTSQLGLTHIQRQQNVKGAFRVPPRHAATIAGRSILLVDDVITTGATANAVAGTLLQAGAREVNVVALALVTDTAGTLQA